MAFAEAEPAQKAAGHDPITSSLGDDAATPSQPVSGGGFASPAVAMAREEGHKATAAMFRRAVGSLEAEVRALKSTLQRERTEAAAEAARRSDAEAGIRRQLMDAQGRVTELGAAAHAAGRAASKAERRAEAVAAEAEAAAAEAARQSEALLRRTEEAEGRAARLGAAAERTGEDLQVALREAAAERRRTEAALTEAVASREAREAAEDARKREAVEAEAARAELSRLRSVEAAALLELRAEVRRLTSAEQMWRQRAADAEEAAEEARAALARFEAARTAGGAVGAGSASRSGYDAEPLDGAPTSIGGDWGRAAHSGGGYGGAGQGTRWRGSPERPSRPPLASESGWRSPEQNLRSELPASADLGSLGAARALDGLRGRGRV